MFYSQLLALERSFSEEFINKADRYFLGLPYNAKKEIAISRVATHLQCSYVESANFLKACTEINFMHKYFVLCCPECGHIIKRLDAIDDIKSIEYCSRCEKELEENEFDSAQDIEIRFEIIEDAPFEDGQHCIDSKKMRESADAVRPDSLQFAWEHGLLEIGEFYSVPDNESDWIARAEAITTAQYTSSTEQGNALENLTRDLFNQCTCFKATSEFKTELNQIDGLVIVNRYLKGNFFDEIGSSFYVECKNEKSTPKNAYISKLLDVMGRAGCPFGVFVSKKSAPKTFRDICHDIYLAHKRVIICISLSEIIEMLKNQENFMDLLHRKYIEVQHNANKNLKELGIMQG